MIRKVVTSLMLPLCAVAALVVYLLSYLLPRGRGNTASTSSAESRQLAHMSYRIQSLNELTDVMRGDYENYRATQIEESLLETQAENIKQAVIAAKQGATKKQIKDKYGLFDTEIDLIVSLHGNFNHPSSH